ncbi:MAG: tyrosine-type recombinase/integrase, partial [Pseudolabrys sp.]
SLHWSEISLEERLARIRETKNDDPRTIRLRSDLCAELAARQPSEPSERVFKFRQGGHLKYLLVRAKLAALGLSCPVRRPTGWKQPPNRLHWANFHTFRHTYATWMRKFGGLDEIGLVATGNWRDPRSARRYAHAVPREEWSKVDSLPSVSRGKSVESR